MNKINKAKVKNEIKELFFIVTLAFVISLSINKFVFARADVVGPSMNSTLHDKDILFCEKISLYNNNLKRGQIITFQSNNSNHDYFVKRIIGIEGDEIKVKDGKVYLNGEELKENYLDKGTITKNSIFLKNNRTYKVKKGEVFVFGDNRGNSYDSRAFGPVKIKDIEGHVVIRVYPFNRVKLF